MGSSTNEKHKSYYQINAKHRKMSIVEDIKGMWAKHQKLIYTAVGTGLAFYFVVYMFGTSTTVTRDGKQVTENSTGGFFTKVGAVGAAAGAGYVYENGTPEFAKTGLQKVSGGLRTAAATMESGADKVDQGVTQLDQDATQQEEQQQQWVAPQTEEPETTDGKNVLHPIWWVLIVLLLLAALGAGVWFFFFKSPKSEEEEDVEAH